MASNQPTVFLLLAIPDTILSIPGHSAQTGLLQLECVTLSVPAGAPSSSPGDPQRDVWLVLKHSASAFELVIPATQTILHSRETQTFVFPIGVAEKEVKEVKLTLPKPTNAGEQEDLDTFEVVLSQYGVLRPMGAIDVKTGGEKSVPLGALPAAGGSTEDLKGRLVLVDEHDGQIVGTLDEEFHLQEDHSLQEPGHEKFPVVIDIPDEPSERPVYVHAVSPEEEEDFLIRSAHMLSRGMIYAASTIASGMNSAASYYVAHSTPNAQPIVFSEASKKNIRTVHKFSGKAVEVTAKTTGLIHSVIDRMVDRVAGADKKNKAPHPSAAYAPGVYATDSGPSTPIPPPLPPRTPSPFRPADTKPGSLAPPPPLMDRKADPVNHPTLTTPGATPPPLPPRQKPRLLNRVLLSTDLLLTAVEKSAVMLVGSATQSISTSLGHKYGKDMGDAAQLAGTTAQNVGIVYIDARGVGRRALLKHAGKRYIKGKIGKKDVVLGGGSSGVGGVVVTSAVGPEDNGAGSSSGIHPGASPRSGAAPLPGSITQGHPAHPPPQYEQHPAGGEQKLGYTPYRPKRA